MSDLRDAGIAEVAGELVRPTELVVVKPCGSSTARGASAPVAAALGYRPRAQASALSRPDRGGEPPGGSRTTYCKAFDAMSARPRWFSMTLKAGVPARV